MSTRATYFLLTKNIMYTIRILILSANIFKIVSSKSAKNEALFYRTEGYRLINSKPISSIVPSSVHCALKCLQNPQCLSYNLEDEARPFHWCELNCLTSDSSRSGLVKSEGYSYYQKTRSHIYGQVDVLPKVSYFMTKVSGQNCDAICKMNGMQCTATGHGFPANALPVFHSIGVNCTTGSDTDVYAYPDNPCLWVEPRSSYSNRCIGFLNIPPTINCNDALNPAIRRLCPCK